MVVVIFIKTTALLISHAIVQCFDYFDIWLRIVLSCLSQDQRKRQWLKRDSAKNINHELDSNRIKSSRYIQNQSGQSYGNKNEEREGLEANTST